jgi:hypothetical protein
LVAIGVTTVAVAAGAVWWIFASAPAGPAPRSATPRATIEPVQSPGLFQADLSTGGRPAEFSAGSVHPTRAGHRLLLGQYGAEGTRFTLTDLPPHAAIHLVMDLATLNSWNGSSTYWGPDVWTCDDLGGRGRKLCSATFCNCGFFSNNNEQSYPDEFPLPPEAASHPAWTGSAERQTLGEMHHFSNTEPALDEDCSSVYHLDWTFPHVDPTLDLRFTGSFKNHWMRFGFLSFRAEAVPTLATLSPAEWTGAWADLDGDDPVKANAAVWKFAAAGDAVIPFLRAQIANADGKPASPYRSGRVEHVLRVIGSAGIH